MRVSPLLAGGNWLTTPEHQSIVNPYTDKVVNAVCLADQHAIDQAIAAAQKGVKILSAMPAHQRSSILVAIASLLEKNQDALAHLITQETGKPITDSKTEVSRCVSTFQFAAQEALRIAGEVIPMDTMSIGEGRLAFTRPVPIGPVLGITPFNFPLNLSAHKIAPAIAVGTSILLKPPPQAPAVCLKLGQIVLDAGLPPEAISVLPCSNALAEGMVRDERINMLSFTGSAKVGWYLKSIAGRKKVVLELGGNAGVIIAADADIAWAAKRCVRGAFVHAGQTCISVQRIAIARPVYEKFLEAFLAQTRQLKTGDPADPGTFIGPMINRDALDKAERLVREALSQGARMLLGGHRKDPFFEPTVLENCPTDCGAVCEEAFSPLAVVEAFDDLDQAIARINASRYGLQAGVFTENLDSALRAASQIEAGGVLINDIPTYRVDSMPYGGIKESGFGREGIRYAMQDMMEPKLIIVNTKKTV